MQATATARKSQGTAGQKTKVASAIAMAAIAAAPIIHFVAWVSG
ncbi:hypothetical protein [Variovorax paradoxus]